MTVNFLYNKINEKFLQKGNAKTNVPQFHGN